MLNSFVNININNCIRILILATADNKYLNYIEHKFNFTAISIEYSCENMSNCVKEDSQIKTK